MLWCLCPEGRNTLTVCVCISRSLTRGTVCSAFAHSVFKHKLPVRQKWRRVVVLRADLFGQTRKSWCPRVCFQKSTSPSCLVNHLLVLISRNAPAWCVQTCVAVFCPPAVCVWREGKAALSGCNQPLLSLNLLRILLGTDAHISQKYEKQQSISVCTVRMVIEPSTKHT